MKLIVFDFAGTLVVKGIFIPHLNEILVALSKKYTLTIVSSLETIKVRDYLDQAQSLSFFSDIIGGEQWNTKAEAITALLAHYHVNKKDAAMITDTQSDVDAAHDAGIQAIAVTWGYEQPHAKYICKDPQALPELIQAVIG